MPRSGLRHNPRRSGRGAVRTMCRANSLVVAGRQQVPSRSTANETSPSPVFAASPSGCHGAPGQIARQHPVGARARVRRRRPAAPRSKHLRGHLRDRVFVRGALAAAARQCGAGDRRISGRGSAAGSDSRVPPVAYAA